MSFINTYRFPLISLVPRRIIPALVLILSQGAGIAVSAAANGNPATPLPVPMKIALSGNTQPATADLETAIALPGELSVLVQAPTPESWINLEAIEFDVVWPETAPADTQVLVHVKDRDYFWYQNLLPESLVPGKANHCRAEFSPAAAFNWSPRGHRGSWHYKVLLEPREVGILVFGNSTFQGSFRIEKVQGISRSPDLAPPAILNVRANAGRVPCYDKFEITLNLPDRYTNPFNRDQIALTGEFQAPTGEKVIVDGFYSQDYYREIQVSGEQYFPQGPPFWRIRFAPRIPGNYRYSITARDACGTTTWGPDMFVAEPPRLPGFVRVAKADPRFLEFDDGSPFFPIGHNVRSPFDSRLDELFPWIQRWPEGPAVYSRIFEKMKLHGETMTEVWSAAWSLGLEWTPLWPGYHGIGQYNLINAWALDRVIEDAERNGLYLNLVIHNHGKFSSFVDPEWSTNPFNTANGGYLDIPDAYFTDPRALASFRDLMRYIVSRWSYSTRIFGWQFWSELDLTGSNAASYRRPEVVEWHRQMGRYVKDIDPNDHLIGTHYCGDYTHQNQDILRLPEMDFCPVDAYHGSGDPLYIVALMQQTAAFNNAFNKPVYITEFGGSPWAQSLKHLDETLHAALWSSVAIPLGGTPLFWWWQLIDEENFYPKYSGVRNFMKGEDRRDPKLIPTVPTLLKNGGAVPGLQVFCLKSPVKALGWIYRADVFTTVDPRGNDKLEGLIMTLSEMQEGQYEVEFWDTQTGSPGAREKVTAQYGAFSVPVPPFARDLAFKVKRLPQ